MDENDNCLQTFFFKDLWRQKYAIFIYTCVLQVYHNISGFADVETKFFLPMWKHLSVCILKSLAKKS